MAAIIPGIIEAAPAIASGMSTLMGSAKTIHGLFSKYAPTMKTLGHAVGSGLKQSALGFFSRVKSKPQGIARLVQDLPATISNVATMTNFDKVVSGAKDVSNLVSNVNEALGKSGFNQGLQALSDSGLSNVSTISDVVTVPRRKNKVIKPSINSRIMSSRSTKELKLSPDYPYYYPPVRKSIRRKKRVKRVSKKF